MIIGNQENNMAGLSQALNAMNSFMHLPTQLGDEPILYRISIHSHCILYEGFVAASTGATFVPKDEKTKGVLWVGRKAHVYRDFDEREHNPHDFAPLSNVFRDEAYPTLTVQQAKRVIQVSLEGDAMRIVLSK
mgnify:CR=1 FL=1